ncbi:MAG: hypothetical protein L3J82_09855, partial [Planctomycetes bacterium]|nr:hypothetical protein [Planctomycetota bacterium]
EERTATIEDEYMQLLRRSAKSMEQSAIHHAQLLKEIVQEHFSQQRRLAVQLMHHLEQLNEKNNHDEMYRELGLAIFEESLKQEKAKLIASLSGGFAQVKKTIEDGQRAEEELAALLPPAKKFDKYRQLFKEFAGVVVDSIRASGKDGKGSSEPEPDATASTDSS